MSKKDPPSRSESQEVANKQEFVEGQRKEIDVKDYAEVQSPGQILKDLEFPATKAQVVTFVERHDPNSELIPVYLYLHMFAIKLLKEGYKTR
ncbi:MAG: hypothetical protein ACM3JQ_01460 [Candidatus Eiseniibacteriota bacterium]